MMCAKRAFLRTPEVEQHGEHRVFPLTLDPIQSTWPRKPWRGESVKMQRRDAATAHFVTS